MTRFARALGLAHEKRFEEAEAEVAALEAIQQRVTKYSAYWAKQVEIQRLAAAAWTAYLSGQKEKGVALMREAAALEASTEKAAVSPGEILPVAELYGDMLLLEERYQDAVQAYETALKRSPRRFNSLYGAGRANALLGNPDQAKAYYAELVEICTGAEDGRPRLAEARKYLQTN
jgi:tetratricopeptide (TPR) repeat protein